MNELVFVGVDHWQARVIVSLQVHLVVGNALHGHPGHVLQGLVHVDLADVERAARAEHAVHQFRQAISFSDDHFGVLGELGLLQFVAKQLRSAANAAQGIFHFVGQAAD